MLSIIYMLCRWCQQHIHHPTHWVRKLLLGRVYEDALLQSTHREITEWGWKSHTPTFSQGLWGIMISPTRVILLLPEHETEGGAALSSCASWTIHHFAVLHQVLETIYVCVVAWPGPRVSEHQQEEETRGWRCRPLHVSVSTWSVHRHQRVSLLAYERSFVHMCVCVCQCVCACVIRVYVYVCVCLRVWGYMLNVYIFINVNMCIVWL